MPRPISALSALLITTAASAAPPANLDADTRTWWDITAHLSNDAMEGRDTGSAAYERAAKLVAGKFEAAGLQPLGDHGGWFQPVPMNEIAVEHAELRSGAHTLKFLFDYSVTPVAAMPATLDARVAYRGYCAASTLGDVRGKIVLCHGTHRSGLPTAAERLAAVKAGSAAGLITIADPGFTVEPPRWPFAYARSVSLADAKPDADALVRITLNADSLGAMVGDDHDPAVLIARGSAGEPLPNFDATTPVHAAFELRRRSIASPNVIGVLPGSDARLAGEAIVLSAHLDGYGHGTPVDGDGIYNGTLDDAAYVALLIRLAEQRHGEGFRRPLIFAAFTGEEKGLLGSAWFVAHPTRPLSRIAADINLDQLRPIFPLELLTVHALGDTSLGDDVRAVAAGMGIAVQLDPEPERNLLGRADQWNFLQAGVPATAFVFGYRPGTASERIYRRWYRTGYHKPQDDLDQPIDWKAAADFNRFFYALVARVADDDAAPAWKPGSKLNPGRPLP